jgi:hypothetical protein
MEIGVSLFLHYTEKEKKTSCSEAEEERKIRQEEENSKED